MIPILSIIIVNYNTKNLLYHTIESIYNSHPKYAYEIIVVDNASEDGSVEMIKTMFRDVKLVQNTKNLGFSKGNNIGITISKEKYILLLNSDTEIQSKTLDRCVEFLNKPENYRIGILGCKVLLPNGKLDIACRRGFPTPLNSFFKFVGLAKLFPKSKLFNGYNLTYLDENVSCDVDCVVGAFMLIRREVIEDIGLLDEDYFMFGEDVDYCYRAKQKGWRVYYYADASIIHKKGGSGRKNPKVIKAFYESMWIFYKKHYLKKYPKILGIIIYVSVKVLTGVHLFLNNFKSKK